MNDGDQILSVEQIAHAYGRTIVLRDVSFTLARGQIAGVIGENGSGKSTLLRIIVGLLAPDRGRVTIRGRPGYCPQECLIYEGLTVRENIRLFLEAEKGRPHGSASDAEAERLLDVFNFRKYRDTIAGRLSGGTKQKLNVTLSALHSPDILILDEPYAGFDWETYLHFWEYARERKRDGKTLLIVSHIAYDRKQFDILYTLREGRIA